MRHWVCIWWYFWAFFRGVLRCWCVVGLMGWVYFFRGIMGVLWRSGLSGVGGDFCWWVVGVLSVGCEGCICGLFFSGLFVRDWVVDIWCLLRRLSLMRV